MASRDDNRARREVDLGGADAVEKTSYVSGARTDPEDRHLELVTASTDPGGGSNPMAWVGIVLLVAVLAMWLAGALF